MIRFWSIMFFPYAVLHYFIDVVAGLLNTGVDDFLEGANKAFEYTSKWRLPNDSKYNLR